LVALTLKALLPQMLLAPLLLLALQ